MFKLIFLILLSFTSACAEFSNVFEVKPSSHTVKSKGVYYTVKEGDTVVSIANQFSVSVQSLVETNNLLEPSSLEVGRSIFIPGYVEKNKTRAARPEKKKKDKKEKKSKKESKSTTSKTDIKPQKAPEVYVERNENKFIWPVDGVVTSKYGVRRGRQHDGIDISAPRGTPVRAAAKGKVVFAKKMSGYGNLVVIKHSGNFFTAYAHLHEYKVALSDKVSQGQLIGLVGSTGRSSGPHCHFEVRHGAESRNPLFFLPQRKEKVAP